MSLVRATIAMIRGVPQLLNQERNATGADLFALDRALAEAMDAVSEHISARHPAPSSPTGSGVRSSRSRNPNDGDAA